MLAACALLGSAASGFAASTWTPGAATGATGCGNNQNTTTLCGSATTVTGASVATTVTATASAYSVSNASAASTFAAAALYDYGSNHLGVVTSIAGAAPAVKNVAQAETSNTAPDHAMDNYGYTELISLKFSSSVALTSITTGYASGDSDMSLLAYTGSNAGYDISGKTIAQLLTDGWKLVANIDGDGNSNGNTYAGLNGGSVSSTWWIVSAYNAAYSGANATDKTTGLTSGDDYVKLVSVAGNITPTTSKVPEPGSLALFAAAGIAALGVSRRRKAGRSA